MSDNNTDHRSGDATMTPNTGDKRSGSLLFLSQNENNNLDGVYSTTSYGASASTPPSAKKTKVSHNATAPTQSMQMKEPVDPTMRPPYSAEKVEALPKIAIYHEGFKKAEDLVTRTCTQFSHTYNILYEKAGYTNPDIERLGKQLMNCRPASHYPTIKPVACLGAAGAGKSSSINCILDQEGLARENDNGDRGTYAVHEYQKAHNDQTELFRVRICLLSRSTISGLITKHFNHIEEHNNADPEDLDPLEREDCRKKYDTGIDFFRALLCDREEFSTRDSAEEYFQSVTSENEKYMLDDIHRMIGAFVEGLDVIKGCSMITAQTNIELDEGLRRFSRPSKSIDGETRPSPWPLISKAEIYLDQPVVNAGVVLGDTPGVSDSNQSVVEAARRYVNGAGLVPIFAPVKRILGDDGLDSTIVECARLGNVHNIYLVCTMIDQKSAISAIDRQDLATSDLALLEAAERNVAKLETDIKHARIKQEKANDAEYRAISNQLEELHRQKAAATAGIDQIAVEIRNRDLATKLAPKLRQLTRMKRMPDLKVHFISNTEYQKHLKGYYYNNPPKLDVEATGIPALRRLLYAVPAHGKFNTLWRICTQRLPAIFNGIKGVLTKTKLARNLEAGAVLQSITRGCATILEESQHQLIAAFEDQIGEFVNAQEEKWSKTAEKRLDNWAQYKTATFSAFCRRQGTWRLPKQTKTKIEWNAILNDIFAAQLGGVFENLEEAILEIGTDTCERLEELARKIKDELEVCADFQGDTGMEDFFENVRLHKDMAIVDARQLFANLQASISRIASNATLNVEDCYTAKAMAPTYDHCASIRSATWRKAWPTQMSVTGRGGVHATHVACIRAKLTGVGMHSVFRSVAKLASEAFSQAIEAWAADFKKDVDSVFVDTIYKDFDRRFVVNDVKNEPDEAFREKLLVAAESALEVIKCEMRENIMACKEYEKNG